MAERNSFDQLVESFTDADCILVVDEPEEGLVAACPASTERDVAWEGMVLVSSRDELLASKYPAFRQGP